MMGKLRPPKGNDLPKPFIWTLFPYFYNNLPCDFLCATYDTGHQTDEYEFLPWAPPNYPVSLAYWCFFLFFRWENRDSKQQSDQPKVKQPRRGRGRTWIWVSSPKSVLSPPVYTAPKVQVVFRDPQFQFTGIQLSLSSWETSFLHLLESSAWQLLLWIQKETGKINLLLLYLKSSCQLSPELNHWEFREGRWGTRERLPQTGWSQLSTVIYVG